jgi:hypothetical protein
VAADVADALAAAARAWAPWLRELAAEFVRRYVRMAFDEGDIRRLQAVEHYNPRTGHAGSGVGTPDVVAGRLIDLIVRHVMGVQVDGDTLRVDPLPFGLERAELAGLRVRSRVIDIVVEGSRFAVTADGETVHGSIGRPVGL